MTDTLAELADTRDRVAETEAKLEAARDICRPLVVDAYEAGVRTADICRAASISAPTLSQWVTAAGVELGRPTGGYRQSRGYTPPPEHDLTPLREVGARLAELKAADEQARDHRRVVALQAYMEGVRYKDICPAAGVTTSVISKWVRRAGFPERQS